MYCCLWVLLYQGNFSFLNTYEWCFFFSIVYSFSEYLLLRFQWCIQELTLNMNPFKLKQHIWIKHILFVTISVIWLPWQFLVEYISFILIFVMLSYHLNQIFFRKHKISYSNCSYNITVFLSQTLKNENTCVEMECLLTLHFTYLIVIWLPQCEQ